MLGEEFLMYKVLARGNHKFLVLIVYARDSSNSRRRKRLFAGAHPGLSERGAEIVKQGHTHKFDRAIVVYIYY